MTIQYRKAILSDAIPLSAMARRCFIDTFESFYNADDMEICIEHLFQPAGVAAQIEDGVHRVRLAEEDGAMAGFVKLGPMNLPIAYSPGSIELKQLYVLKAWQGSGVAAALMDWAIAEARAEDAPAVFLSVYEKNARAIAFYKRYGFEIVGEAPFTVGSHIDMDPVMRKTLRGGP